MTKAEWFDWTNSGKVDISNWEFDTCTPEDLSGAVASVLEDEPPEIEICLLTGDVRIAVGLPFGEGGSVYWRAGLREVIVDQLDFLPAKARTLIATALRSIAAEVEASTVPCPEE